jgi:hypothetical protein
MRHVKCRVHSVNFRRRLMGKIEMISLIFLALILRCGVSNANCLINNATLKDFEVQNNDTIEIDYYKALTDSFPYENYKVTEIYYGKSAKIKLSNLKKLSKDIIEDIKIQYNNQMRPNFAGHYIIVSWGCGSPCQMNAIIDMKSGKAVDFFVTSIGLCFNCDSYLLILDPPSYDGFDKGFRAFIGDPRFKILKNDKVIDLN